MKHRNHFQRANARNIRDWRLARRAEAALDHLMALAAIACWIAVVLIYGWKV